MDSAASRSRHGGAPAPSIPAPLKSIKPGENFYKYINGGWQKGASIPSFAGSYGVSEEIEERVRGDILESIKRLTRKEPGHPLVLLAKSVTNHGVQDNNVRDLRRMLAGFECLRSTEDVAQAIGRLNRIQSRAPVTFSVNADTFKSNMCRVHIYEPVMGLPAKHYYHTTEGATAGSKNRTILAYGELLRKMGHMLETDDLEAVIPIEKACLPFLSEGDSLRNPSESYIPLTLTQLEKEYTHIPWRTMLLSWGMPTDLIRESTYIVTNDNYMSHFNKMFKVFDLQAWRVWIRASIVLTFMEYLPPPFDDLHFDFFNRRLRGSAQKLPQHLLMLRVLQTFATQALSRVFVEDHIPDAVKEDATVMVRRLKSATIRRIRALQWMSETTKRVAVAKVKAMRFQVAYPSEWYSEFTGVTVDPERLLNNLIALNTRDTVRTVGSLGEGCGESDGTWDDGAFDVNAYYYPDKNQLTIPAGMLRPPFFDLRRSAAWNYGGIGCAIGHEITHGFDSDGKNYDLRGSYKDWWLASDNTAYEKISQGLVEMYEGEEYLGGRVDGRLTLSENIADIGGVAISLTALREYMLEKKMSASERLDALRDFFTSYAVSWRNKDRPRKARQSLYLDVHSPAPLRVNMVVRQFKEFYDAFDIHEGDEGWIPEKDRIQLW